LKIQIESKIFNRQQGQSQIVEASHVNHFANETSDDLAIDDYIKI
jgi:hypothetical protein